MCPAAIDRKGIAMTIYSHHASRGKVQILATYRSPAGVMSSTVTSVEDTALAAPIVDALNWISACATVPVSVYDTREDKFEHYPAVHLTALTDRSARDSLLTGAHSLWYEHIKVVLHEALINLDDATANAPAPVRNAIAAELEAEARRLREALADYHDGITPPEDESQRLWTFNAPFVIPGAEAEGLGGKDRERLNQLEWGITKERLSQAVADLRLLLDAYTRCANEDVSLAVDDFTIMDDPLDSGPDRFFLDVQAPMPNGAYSRDDWRVEVCQWIPDDPDDEDVLDSTGEPILCCTRSTPPTVAEIVELLNRSGGRQEQLATWAKTPVGDTLAGTAFVVTERYDD